MIGGFWVVKSMKEVKVCKVEGCQRTDIAAKELCSKHYIQVYRHGKVQARTKFDPNEYKNCGSYFEIILCNMRGKECARSLVDYDDKKKVDHLKWYLGGCRKGEEYVKNKRCLLHHLIFEKKDGFQVDHINGNKLDNRKHNLRFVTHSQNQHNRISRGYYFHKSTGQWMVRIMVNNKQLYFGRCDLEEDAKAKAIEVKANFHGEYART